MSGNNNQGTPKPSTDNSGWETIGEIKNPKTEVIKFVKETRIISDGSKALKKIAEETGTSFPVDEGKIDGDFISKEDPMNSHTKNNGNKKQEM
jgi:hypothetical protein